MQAADPFFKNSVQILACAAPVAKRLSLKWKLNPLNTEHPCGQQKVEPEHGK
jgi:hypothetical protein